MTRRGYFTGIAVGTMFLPACSSISPQTAMTPFRPNGPYPPTGNPAVQNPYANPYGNQNVVATMPPDDLFAMDRREAAPTGVVRNVSKQQPGEINNPETKPTPAPEKSPIELVDFQQNKSETMIVTPRLHPSATISTPIPEPMTDATGVVRPNWPVIKGPGTMINPPVEPPLPPTNPSGLPTIPEPAKLSPAILNAPIPEPEKIISSSEKPAVSPPAISQPAIDAAPLPMEIAAPTASSEKMAPIVPIPNHQQNSTSFILPSQTKDEVPAAIPVIQPVSTSGRPSTSVESQSIDTPLIQAVRAFQQNKPQAAMEILKAYDQPTQQVLLSIMPALVQLSEGRLQQMKREEMDLLLDQITRVPQLLRPRASLQTNKLLLCREVHKFAHVDPFPPGNEFRPGDMVYLYAEISNFSCVPDSREGYSVALTSHLELLDSGNNAVWRADPKEEADRVSTPPQDYYRAYRFCVPSSLAPGKYTLSIRLTDKPTGRETTKSVEFRVGAK